MYNKCINPLERCRSSRVSLQVREKGVVIQLQRFREEHVYPLHQRFRKDRQGRDLRGRAAIHDLKQDPLRWPRRWAWCFRTPTFSRMTVLENVSCPPEGEEDVKKRPQSWPGSCQRWASAIRRTSIPAPPAAKKRVAIARAWQCSPGYAVR